MVSRRIVQIVRTAAHRSTYVFLSRLHRYADRERVRALQKHGELLKVSGTKQLRKDMDETEHEEQETDTF